MSQARLLTPALLLLALPLHAVGDEKDSEALPPKSARSRIEPYVDWLPWTSETLIVFDQLYQVPPDPRQRASFHEISLPQMFQGDARNMLAGKLIKLRIEAASGFHYPIFPEEVRDAVSSVGVTFRYDGCHILVFDERTPLDTTALFETLLQQHPEPTSLIPAAARHRIAGYAAIAYSSSPTGRHANSRATPDQRKRIAAALSVRYWIASPMKNVLIVATSRAVLAETLRKVEHPDPTAFPATLEEWQQITGEMPIWGMRHYHTLPRRGDMSDLREEGRRMSGFTFEIDPTADKAELTFLDCNPKMIRSVRYNIVTYVYSDAKFTEGPDGRLVVHLDSSEKAAEDAFDVASDLVGWLVFHLGHAYVI